MLSDLSKYITREFKIDEYGTASLMLNLLEHVQSDRIAESILTSFRNNMDVLEYEGTDLLMDIIWDVHFQDIVMYCEIQEQFMINMMMSCFNMEYLSETWVNDIDDYCLRYTYRGTQITRSQENILCSYIEQEWPDFVHEFRDEEYFEQWEKGNSVLELGEEYEFRAMHIILDVNNPYYDEVVHLLEGLGFSQVDEELMMYGCYCGIGYESCEPSFDYIKMELISLLKNIPSKRKLSKSDVSCLARLSYADGHIGDMFAQLASIKPYSNREVIL